MCAIIGWAGILPKGLLTKLLLRSEHRGLDSTGFGFQVGGLGNYCCKAPASATRFVNDSRVQEAVGQARKSVVGIGHTRRASPGMPIDEFNAHPFGYWQILFAHNGRVENWTTKTDRSGVLTEGLKQSLIRHFSEITVNLAKSIKDPQPGDDTDMMTRTLNQATDCLNYCRNITTDSMVLGPFIHKKDFTAIQGSLALVWMQESSVFTYRHSKEAVAATVLWNKIGETQDNVFTIVTSTKKILMESLQRVKDIEFEVQWLNFDEGVIYQVKPAGLIFDTRTGIANGIIDTWSSKEDTDCEPTIARGNKEKEEDPTPDDDAPEDQAELSLQLQAELDSLQ